MNATESQVLYFVIAFVTISYFAIGVWWWRTCATAPIDPDDEDYPFSEEGRAVLRTKARNEGKYWDLP